MAKRVLDVAAVAEGLAPCRVYGTAHATLAFANVVHDSRLAGPGSLFVALRGERDGHAFAADAIRRGASGVLGERLLPETEWLAPASGRPIALFVVDDALRGLQRLARWWRLRQDAEVIGVTGSVGKTSTKEVLAGLLSRRWRVLRNEKNYNNELGLPLTLLTLDGTYDKAVLEMGMYDLGEIRDLCALALPSVGVVTNVGPVHLERLGTMGRIAAAKSELVQALPPEGLAVLNGDDARVRAMAGLTQARVVFYGFGDECEVRASAVEPRGLDGVNFTLHAAGRSAPARLRLVGRHQVYNALAGVAVALHAGLAWEEIIGGLGELQSELRLVSVPGRNGSLVIDDTYNASPASVLAALDVLAQLPGRRTAILGDMLELGSYEEEGHREVGRRAAQVLSALVAVGPRARLIGAEAQAGGLVEVAYAPSSAAVDYEPRTGEHILVKGSRSMAMEDVVARLRAGEVAG